MKTLTSLHWAMPVFIRRLAAWVLPMRSRLGSPNVSHVRSLAVRRGIRMDVYWLGGRAGPGSCAAMIVHGDEVMRLDCLGAQRGHMHINLKQTRGFRDGGSARLYFREPSVVEQIDRACFELEHNLLYALTVNGSARIRRVRLTAEEIDRTIRFVRIEMLALQYLLDGCAAAGSASSHPMD